MNPSIWADQFDQYLGPDVPEQVLYMFSNEGVVHDIVPVVFEDRLEFVDIVILVRHHEVRHGKDLWVVLVWFRFLRVERIDARFHKPVENENIILKQL